MKGPFYKDVETGLYYLNSRYYNPEIRRFINADGLLGAQGDILGHNMYAYTKNNPVMMVDPSGYSATLAALGAAAGSILASPLFWIGVTIYAFLVYTPVGNDILSDALDAVNDVKDSISQAASEIKDKIKEKIKSTSVSISTALVAKEKRNNGTYAIQFSNGNYYIGKGSPFRMYASAIREGLFGQSVPVSFRFEWASNDEQAFINEYKWMVDYGYYSGNPDFYNRRWSPGRTKFYKKYKRLYGDDYWGR